MHGIYNNQKSYRRASSLLLLLSLLIGLSSQVPAGKTADAEQTTIAQPAGVLRTYDLKKCLAAPNTTSTAFSDTYDRWKYYGQIGGWTTQVTDIVNFNAGLQAKYPKVGDWFAIELKDVAAGMYAARLQHNTAFGGVIAELFLMPADTADISANLTDATSVGIVDFYSSPSAAWVTTTLDAVNIPLRGNYILVFKFKDTDEGNPGGRYIYPGVFVLDGTSGLTLSGSSASYNFTPTGNVPATSATGTATNFTQINQGFSFRVKDVTEYLAIDITIDEPGRYHLTQLCHNYTSGGRTAVYLAPASVFDGVSDILSVLTEDQKLGVIDCYAASGVSGVSTKLPDFYIPEEGSYKLIYLGTNSKTSASSNYYMFATELRLDGTYLESLNLAFDKETIKLGETGKATVTGKNTSGNEVDLGNATISYESNQPEIVSIDPVSGVMTAKSEGDAVIKVVVTHDGLTISEEKSITIIKPILQSVSLALQKYTLRVGDTSNTQIEAISDVGAEDLSKAEITYDVGNKDIAEVDQQIGIVTAKAVGNTEITASVTLYGITKTDSKRITVLPVDARETLESVTLIFDKSAISVGGVAKASVKGKTNYDQDADLSTAQITYASSDSGVATVSNDGTIEGHGTGVCEITVTAVLDGVSRNDIKNIIVGKLSGEERIYNLLQSSQTPWNTTYNMTNDKWAYAGQSAGWEPVSSDMIVYSAGLQIHLNQAGKWVAFKIKVPTAGLYYASLDHGAFLMGKSSDVYLMPASVSDIAENLNEQYYLGEVQSYRYPSVKDAHTELGDVMIENPGEYCLAFKMKENDGYIYPNAFILQGIQKLRSISLSLEDNDLDVGENVAAELEAVLTDGSPINLSDCSVVYVSSDEQVATVDINGNITARSEGSANIQVTVEYDGDIKSVSQTVNVTDRSELLSVELKGPENIYVRGSGVLTQIANMASGNTISVPSSQVSYTVVSVEPAGAAEVSQEGVVSGISAGTITIKATSSFKEKEFETNLITINIITSSKTKPSIWTSEERATILENVNKYSWAKSQMESYKAEADKYVDFTDEIYNMIAAEGLPRYYSVGSSLDPNRTTCRYCGADLLSKYGKYSWLSKPLTDPWKIQCPDCKRRFPSNDFGSYYKLGLDEHGIFNKDIAKQKNDELIANGQPGYLVNILYPEKEEYTDDMGVVHNEGVHGWGVDDGYGYKPGRMITETVEEVHTYIAYYLHFGIWCPLYKDGSANPAVVLSAIDSMKNAYLFTGEAKYGRVGAILLDRVADFYPGFDWYQWRDMRKDNYRGKIVDQVWECDLSQRLTEAYDAFFPIYEDPQVINYLSKKSKQYKQENPKDSAVAIRVNIEDGILREIFDAAVTSKIMGNYGMSQYSVALAAVALDTMPETGEWIEWLMHPGVHTANPRYGGNILNQIVDVVDRDGMGTEASPSYNSAWLDQILNTAEILSDYEAYPSANLYMNPKFIRMFTAQLPLIMSGYYTMQIGDTGSTASSGFNFAQSHAEKGFKRFGDIRLAQYAFLRNGNTVEGMHEAAWVKNPEGIQNEILNVINKYGEYNPNSDMMTGYGFAALRDGARYKSVGIDKELNTQRDFSIYFGIGTGHGHNDALNLGIDAYGLNMAPDLGYPEATGTQPNRMQWVSRTLSHNTVMVDGKTQTGLTPHGIPMHFDDSGRVKVMDIEANKVYSQTKSYRRTVVMVEASDEVSYGVDFFRVLGGNDHVYSFHSQSDEIFETEGLDIVPQKDEKNNYVGTYAGADVPWGKDPNTIDTSWTVDMLKYPPGSTWLDNVRRDENPSAQFAVDFKVKDFRRILPTNQNLHLRMTMLNSFNLTEVAIANGSPPRVAKNMAYMDKFEYVLARRTGTDLDTLFTTIFEPYKDERYLLGMTGVTAEAVDKIPGKDDVVKAVKVIHKGENGEGRIDYIIYATNNSVTYEIDGLFNFRGFVGVYSLKDGKPIYSYLNDGDVLGDSTDSISACTGLIKSFTRELSMNNTINIQTDTPVDPEKLVGKFIYINNDKAQNGAYRIIGVSAAESGEIELNTGDVSLIRSYKDPNDTTKGFNYNIASGQSFRIPLSEVVDNSPVFSQIEEKTVDARSEIRFNVSATSPLKKALTYRAVSLPRGASFIPETRTFVWIPDDKQVGAHHAAIEVFDGALTTTQHIAIEVLGATSGKKEKPPVVDNDTNNDSQPDGQQPVVQQPQPVSSERFTDLNGFEWASDAINQLAEVGIITGTGENTFSPKLNVTRADFVLLLTRAFKLTGEAESFTDVPQDAYYAQAISAARQNEIITGLGDNRFLPTAEISREDMMVILTRAMAKAGITLTARDGALDGFPDAGQISDYARESVALLVSEGIVTGANGTLNPKGKATRAEIAVILQRILQRYKNISQ